MSSECSLNPIDFRTDCRSQEEVDARIAKLYRQVAQGKSGLTWTEETIPEDTTHNTKANDLDWSVKYYKSKDNKGRQGHWVSITPPDDDYYVRISSEMDDEIMRLIQTLLDPKAKTTYELECEGEYAGWAISKNKVFNIAQIRFVEYSRHRKVKLDNWLYPKGG